MIELSTRPNGEEDEALSAIEGSDEVFEVEGPLTKRRRRRRTSSKEKSKKNGGPVTFRKNDAGETIPIHEKKEEPARRTIIIEPPQPKDKADMGYMIEWVESLQPPTVTPVPSTRVEIPDQGFTEAELLAYAKHPIPESGLIGREFAPLIKWDMIEKRYMPPDLGKITYFDFPHPDAPDGILVELRDAFRRNREYVCQGKDPVNLNLQGPPGTGKTLGVKAFAAETGLPYYYIPADPNVMTVEQLLGWKEIVTGDDGKMRTVWHDGTIVKAAKTGGILGIDEWTLLDAEVQTRLHELLDAQRRLSLEGLAGFTVNAHPDLFIVLSGNPQELGTQHARATTAPVRSRVRGLVMDYPPKHYELEIIKKQLDFSDSELSIKGGMAYGTLSDPINRFMEVVHDLRGQGDEIYVPTLREAVDFGREIKAGTEINKSLHRALTGKYVGEDRAKVDQAVQYQFSEYR